MSESTPEFVTVAEVSERLGISPRAIQKRCQSGKLKARLVETPQGNHWEIEAAQLARTGEPANDSQSRTGEPNQDAPPNVPDQKTANLDANPRTESREPTNEPANARTEPDAITSTLLSQAREEILFLRGLVEQRDRDNAETRAALREALKAMPKAIAEGNSNPTVSTPKKEAESAEESGAGQAQSTPVEQTTRPEISKPQNGLKRKISPWQRAVARVLGIRLGDVE